MLRRTIVVFFAAGALVTTAVASPPGSGDRDLARRLVLQARDLPSSWKPTAVPNETKQTACERGPAKFRDRETAKAESAFKGDTESALSAAVIFRTSAAGRSAFRYIAGRLRSCLFAGLRKDGYKVSTRSIVMPRLGDESVGLKATIDRDDLLLPADGDVVIVRSGRALAIYVFADLSPSDTRQELAEVKRAISRA